MGLSSWQVLRACTCHRQPEKKNLYFLIELIEIYLPVPIVYFSNEKYEAPSPKCCSCKISLYQGFLGIFENLDFWTFDHCILYSFLPGFSLWQRRIDSTKQMMVYDQITLFINISFFFYFFDVQKTWLFRSTAPGRRPF